MYVVQPLVLQKSRWLLVVRRMRRRAEALEAVDLYVEAAANPAMPAHDAGVDWPLIPRAASPKKTLPW